MKKILASAVLAVALLGAGSASAAIIAVHVGPGGGWHHHHHCWWHHHHRVCRHW